MEETMISKAEFRKKKGCRGTHINSGYLVASESGDWVSVAKDLDQVKEQVLEMVANGVLEAAITVYKVSETFSVKVEENVTVTTRR
jgi:hypothetical protein